MLIYIILFLSAALLNYRISLVGELSIGEIILLLASPLALSGLRGLMQNRYFRIVLILLVAYFLELVITDIYRQSSAVDYLRGWAKLLMTTSSFVILGGMIRGRERGIVAFVIGYACSVFVSRLTSAEVEVASSAEQFKYGLGLAVSLLVFLAVERMGVRRRPVLALIPLGLGGFALFINSRSLAGIIIMAALAPFLVQRLELWLDGFSLKSIRRVLAAVVAALVVVSAYGYLASRGYLGTDAGEKYLLQSERRGGFSIFAGRNEIYYTMPKIIESPILGWGSWHKDPAYVVERSIQMGMSEPAAQFLSMATDGLVPSHSHLFGGWLEAGIMGAVFWIYVLYITNKVLVTGAFHLLGSSRYAILFLLTGLDWDIFFSPYAGDRRVSTAFIMFVAVSLLKTRDDYAAAKMRAIGHPRRMPAAKNKAGDNPQRA